MLQRYNSHVRVPVTAKYAFASKPASLELPASGALLRVSFSPFPFVTETEYFVNEAAKSSGNSTEKIVFASVHLMLAVLV